MSLEAHGAQLGNGFAQQFGAQIGQDELCPLLAQRLSKSKTQAAGSAGHKDPAPSELTGGRHGVEGHLKPCLFQI
ncbi:glycine betaine ABC transporter ATP-binding protein [Comamonas sp. E6]|nr:glycine betaine ABC transporter ATP-binding protein [Comamonas sp. E6]